MDSNCQWYSGKIFRFPFDSFSRGTQRTVSRVIVQWSMSWRAETSGQDPQGAFQYLQEPTNNKEVELQLLNKLCKRGDCSISQYHASRYESAPIIYWSLVALLSWLFMEGPSDRKPLKFMTKGEITGEGETCKHQCTFTSIMQDKNLQGINCSSLTTTASVSLAMKKG